MKKRCGAILAAALAAFDICCGAFPNKDFPASFRARSGTDVESVADGPLIVRSRGTFGWPGIEMRPVETNGVWDWSNVGEVVVVVSNGSERATGVFAAVMGEGMTHQTAPTCHAVTPPHAVRTIVIPLAYDSYVTDETVPLAGMRGKIGSMGTRPDFSRTRCVDVFEAHGEKNPRRSEFSVLSVGTRFAARKPKVILAKEFFPFVDRYGQFRHADWPGKIHSDEELAAARKAEEAWLAEHRTSPIPDADKYGGWAGGPQLKATGFFRTEKVNGKWWFVDPEGHLFFSLGIDSLYPGLDTPVGGRECYFLGLSSVSRPDSRRVFFVRENLARKYGKSWQEHYADTLHLRFKAWGFNTLGNWTQEDIRALRRTPYVATVDFSSRTVLPTWKSGDNRPVPNVYSEAFVDDLRRQLETWAVRIRDDPWCLGVFVDNEIGWSGCGAEAGAVAEKYYSAVRAVLKEVLPNHLYLGSRIHQAPSGVWLAAARDCDVVSCNVYEREPSYDLPAGAADKPIIIGEFHFGAKDRGHFIGGLQTVYDQNERAVCFRRYVESCLDNPRYVGCHWFQYHDQPLSGRWDGENFNAGFVSVCDVPYPELVEAARTVASEIYSRRSGGTTNAITRKENL